MLILYYIFKTVSTLHCWTRLGLSKQCSQCLKKLLHQVSLRKKTPEPLSGLTVGVWGTPSWVSVRYRAVIGLRFGDCLRPFFAFLPKGGFDLLATYENLILASLQYTKGSKSCWSKKLLMSFSHPPPISFQALIQKKEILKLKLSTEQILRLACFIVTCRNTSD